MLQILEAAKDTTILYLLPKAQEEAVTQTSYLQPRSGAGPSE